MEIFFRGFHANEIGNEEIWTNGTCQGEKVKGKVNGNWVYGYYCKATRHWHKYGIHNDWIITSAIQNGGFFNVMGRYAVIAETVGQFTGLTDKNGKKIFEGDIVKFTDSWGKTPKQGTAEIVFEHSSFKYSGSYDGGNPIVWLSVSDMSVTFEVIGTIFDKEEQNAKN